jgi:hypothetical protein
MIVPVTVMSAMVESPSSELNESVGVVECRDVGAAEDEGAVAGDVAAGAVGVPHPAVSATVVTHPARAIRRRSVR